MDYGFVMHDSPANDCVTLGYIVHSGGAWQQYRIELLKEHQLVQIPADADHGEDATYAAMLRGTDPLPSVLLKFMRIISLEPEDLVCVPGCPCP